MTPDTPDTPAKIPFSSMESTAYSVGGQHVPPPTHPRHTPDTPPPATPDAAMTPHTPNPARWFAALPTEPTPAASLAQALAPMPPQQIAEQMALAGWRRELVWSRAPDGRRLCRVWWSPPRQSAPRTPRGRPRTYLNLAETLALFK